MKNEKTSEKYPLFIEEIQPILEKYFKTNDEVMMIATNLLCECIQGNPNVNLADHLIGNLIRIHGENARNFIMMAQPQGSA